MSAKKLPIFEGKDWRVWSIQAKAVLMTKKLWSTTSRRPTSEQTSSETWIENNDQAMGYILQMVHPAYHFTIMDTSTAAGMWSRLQAQYGQADRGSYDRALTDYVNFKIDSDEEPTKYGARFLAIVQDLNILSQELKLSLKDEAESVHRLLIAAELLGISDATVQVLKNTSGVTVHKCIRDLQHAFEVRKMQAESANAIMAVKKATKLQTPPNSCRTTSANTAQTREKKKFAGKCFWCQKKGHRLADCRSKKAGKPKVIEGKEESSNQATASSYSSKAKDESSQAFVTLSNATDAVTDDDGWQDQWILDTGATRHMTGIKSCIQDMQSSASKITILLGDNSHLSAEGEGSTLIETHDGILNLSKVLYVPGLKRNLISYGQAEKDGFKLESSKEGISLHHPDQDTPIHARRKGNLYIITRHIDHANAIKTLKGSLYEWHCRLGHAGVSTITRMMTTNAVQGMDKVSSAVRSDYDLRCKWCQQAKQTREPFSKDRRNREDVKVLSIVSSDLCGPLTPARDGSLYFATFTDEASNYTVVVNLKKKSDTLKAFKDVLAWMERSSERKMKALRSDGGGEYSSHAFKGFLIEKGIEHIITAPGTPQDNGNAERKNRSLLETMRAQMKQAGMENNLWHLAIKAAVYIRNRTGFPKTPFERFIGSKPNVSNLKPLGCRAWVHIPGSKRTSKLDDRSKEAVLVGFEVGSRNYLFMLKDYSIFTSRDAVFDEDVFPMRDKKEREQKISLLESSDEEQDDSDSELEDSDSQQDCQENQDKKEVQPSVPRRSTRARKPPGEWWKVQSNNTDFLEYALSLDTIPAEPKSYKEAVSGKDATKWKEAMQEEIASLMKNDVWDLVPLPKDRKPITCRWVFKIKTNPDNTIERYKARLVVRGFTQKQGIDFKETFAPVAKYPSLRLLFARAASEKLDILQLDIKTAFLYGDLEEETYMMQPEGFSQDESSVCKLKRTLYGLKQAPRGWNQRIHNFLVNIGFTRMFADHCVYVNPHTTLLLWVDDILLFGSKSANDKIYRELAAEFDVSYIGYPKRVVGIHIDQDQHKIRLHQTLYAEEVLKRFKMQDCKPVNTPCTGIDSNTEPFDKTYYMQLLGSVMFLMIGTRPDIAYTVNLLSRALKDPTHAHWIAGKRLLRYIAGSRNLGLEYKSDAIFPSEELFVDADWGNDKDRRSITGMACTLGGTAVSWSSKKQSTVALSSTEAEYQALTEAAKEAVWIRGFLKELGYQLNAPTRIYNDNTGAIALARDPVHHSRTKHIAIKHHFIRELLEKHVIVIKHMASEDMPADLLTKSLGATPTRDHRAYLGLQPIHGVRSEGGCCD